MDTKDSSPAPTRTLNDREAVTDSAPGEEMLTIQRWLGRCMLRLQQYEALLKVLLAEHEVGGLASTFEAQQAARKARLSGMTLGALVNQMFDRFVVSSDHEHDAGTTDDCPPDDIFLSVRLSVAKDAAQLASVRAGIAELVSMRNALVHHFIGRFDLRQPAGRAAALRHLEDCHERIVHHHDELVGWARQFVDARQRLSAFMQSDQFTEFWDNGITPDGHFEWWNAGIVRTLREAGRAFSVEGWTRLDRAREWLAEHYPDQTPEKYGCRTWPQVLHESKQFDLAYRIGDDGRKVAWFRECAIS